MRILVLNYEYPPVGGGGGRASADLAEALARRGHSLHVLTTGVPGLPAADSHGLVDVTRLGTGRRSSSEASFWTMLRYILAACTRGFSLVRAWRPDVLHAHFAVPTGAAALILSRLTRVPYVLTVHLGDLPGGVPEKTDRWFRWVGRLTPPIWNGASSVVAVSEYTRQLARRSYSVPIQVVPNGVDLRRRPARPAIAGSPPMIAFVGRFQPQKEPILLVDILAAVRDQEWRAVLIGDGPMRASVERRLRETGLTDRVELTGWIGTDQAEAMLAAADLLLMPSRAEGLPVVGVQAIAHGLALVTSRVGGMSELVVDGVNGYGLPPGDLSGFVEALRKCLASPAALSAMKAASFGMAGRYDVERIAETYEGILGKAAGS